MGNDFNCCQNDSRKDNIVSSNHDSQNGRLKEEPVANKFKAGAKFNLTEIEEKNSYVKETPKSMQNDSSQRNITITEDVNTNVTNKKVLTLSDRVLERESQFPEFTRIYAIQKGNLNESDLARIYKKENTVYDNGTYSNNVYYTGERNKNGLRHGFGTLITSDGDKLIGFWNNDELHFYSRHIYSNLVVQEGIFEHGQLDGKGEEHDLNSVYNGEFSHGVKNGFGKLETDSDLYEGNFEDGLKHGKGSIVFKKTNNKYEGQFIEGKIEGKGSFTWSNGDTYKGEFSNGILNGYGVYRWNNGDVYEGSYINGVRIGKGKLTNANGKIYEGEFMNNLPHGLGKITKDGKTMEVEFVNGVIKKK